jgi:hypothetical protein
MTWRDPKSPQEFVDATCGNLRELAAAYSPILRFDDRERLFPVLAESWLTHTSAAPWSTTDEEEDDLVADSFRRGSAICTADVSLVGGPVAMGGAPNPHNRPIQFSSAVSDPDAIGAYDDVDALTFLDFGGWIPDGTFRHGNADYLYRAFSELSCAMNQANPWLLVEGDPNLPHLWVPQPVNPTAYCEVEWAGIYSQWSTAAGLSDFPLEQPGDTPGPLDLFMCLTYYYLYPMRDVPPEGAATRRLEGQWEAISLFFAGDAGPVGEAGRPEQFTYREPPEFVVISKGIERSFDEPLRQHPNEVRRWGNVEREHAHPVIYVTAGTHRNSFFPFPGTRWFPVPTRPDGDDAPAGAGEFPGVESLLLWSFAAGVAASLLAGIGAVLLAAWFAALAILLMLCWLISLIWDAINQASGDPIGPSGDIDEANGSGAQAGSTEEPPAGGSSGPNPTANQPPGTPNAGSPTGQDIVSFDVRVVDMLHEAEERTGFPSDSFCEHPHWWPYTGSWGINVPPGVDNDWESGTRRVDEFGRSWGYWHALRMLTFVNGGSAGP